MTSKKTTPQTALKIITTPSKTITSKRTEHTKYLESSSDSEVDDQTCCVCFGEYRDDEEWVCCSCGRWLHEDCTLNDEPSALELCASCVLNVIYTCIQYSSVLIYHIMNIENVPEAIIVKLTTNSTVY